MNPVAAGDTFPEKLNPLYGNDQIVRDGCMWKTMWMPCCQLAAPPQLPGGPGRDQEN